MSAAYDPIRDHRGPLRRWFFRIIFFATALANGVLGIAVACTVRPVWLGVVLAAMLVVVLTYLLRGRLRLALADRTIGSTRRFFERAYYAHWAGSIGALVVFLPLSIASAFDAMPLAHAALASYLVGLALGTYGVFVRQRWFKIRTVEIPVALLPAALEGYRIAQLSDLHVGSLLPAEIARRWVRRTNELDVDLVALTGDYVTSGTHHHEIAANLMGELRAKDGVFAVLGNHDNFGGCEPLVSTLRTTSVKLLQNERAIVSRDGVPLLEIAGVDDVFTRRADVEKTFEGRDSGLPVLALAHDPKQFTAIAKKGAFLVLSGHTHWGQIGVPLFERTQNLARPFFRYSAHLYREGESLLYVNPGLGTTGPPVRFGVPPEITVFVLKKA